jgi:hypothetical protein
MTDATTNASKEYTSTIVAWDHTSGLVPQNKPAVIPPNTQLVRASLRNFEVKFMLAYVTKLPAIAAQIHESITSWPAGSVPGRTFRAQWLRMIQRG